MKHIDKSMGVNLHLLDSTETNPDKKAIMERINIVILILLGCGGLYVYSNINSPKKPGIRFSNLTANSTVLSSAAATSNSLKKQAAQEDYIQIKGYPEAGTSLAFIIDAYDENANYRIDFGDGHIKTMTDEKINHVYENAGQYRMQLIIGYHQEPVQRIEKKIIIEEAFETVSGTYRK